MFKPLLTLLPLICLGAAVWAAPLDRRQLPADVKWFIHVDADAGRSSKTGQAFLDAWRAQAGTKPLMDQMRSKFNIDPTQDIRGVTVYGNGYTAEACVLVIRGKIDQQKLLARLHGANGFQASMHTSHELFTWTEGPAGAGGRRSSAAFFGTDTVLVGASSAAVGCALDLFDGNAKPLLGSTSPLAEVGPAGSIIEAGAIGLADARDLPIQSPVLRQCDYGLIWAGEFDGRAFCKGSATATTPEVAENVRMLMAGARAFAQLNGDNTDLAKLFEPVEITRSDRTVHVDWKMPAKKFADLVIGTISREANRQNVPEPRTKP